MKQAPVLTDKDIKQLLGYLATTGYHPRNRCMLMLSWLTGMRVGELASLKMGDVLTPAGEVRTEIQRKRRLRPIGYRGFALSAEERVSF